MSDPARKPPSHWLFLILFASVVLFVYRPLLQGQALLERDILRWILPARFVLREALSHHRLPLWNPWQGIGFPALSDPLYGLFYPPTLLTLFGPLVGSTMLFLLLHVLSGGVGSYLLARRLQVSSSASLIAAFTWSLSGYVAADWTTGIRLLSSSYFPWSALAWLALARACQRAETIGWRSAPIAAIPAALVFLTGEVFLAMIVSGFGMLVACADLDLQDRPAIKRFALASLLALAVTALAGSVAVIPAAMLAPITDRALPLHPNIANGFSLHPARVIEFVAPGGIGRAFIDLPEQSVQYTRGKLLNLSLYLGAASVALSLCAPYKQRIPRAFAALGVVLILLSLGPATPLLSLLRLVVRPFAYMRAPEKFLAGVVPLVSALAAMGTARLLAPGPLPWKRLLAFAAFLAAFAAASSWLYSAPVAPLIASGCLRSAAVVLIVLAIARLSRARPLLAVMLLALTVVIDDAQFLAQFHLYFPSSLVGIRPVPLRFTDPAAAERAPAPVRVFRSDSINAVFGRVTPLPGRLLVIDSLQENISVLWGVATLPGYDPAMPSILRTVLATHRRDALRLLSVDYTLQSAPSRSSDAPREGLTEVAAPMPGVRLYRVERSLPRAFLAGSVVRRPLRDLDAHLLDTDVVSGRVALVNAPSPVASSAPAPLTPCVIERYEPGSLVARCLAARPALAVFVEQHAPGWSATVDGRSAPLLQADRLLLGVPVAIGPHRIELRYRAPGLTLGGAFSLAAWTMIAASLAHRVRRRLRGA